ncbi:cytosolic 5'-nucleotidase 3-like isoform X1 [Acanthaster planci]|uniref:5'-nucleotidase n=2 Tax=Acanthaster planci TaxID=133434 RepID=A0A8B8A1R0_ACAPL|nr:cytosolic 5'-nucleotidase 3-like isoform X1 [Acanthaster planci]
MLHSSSLKFVVGAGVAALGVITLTYVLNGRKRKRTKIIEMMDEFQKTYVHMKDPDRVEELVTQLIKDGRSKLLVVTDFDRTLSRFQDNEGRKVPTCHGVLDISRTLPEDYRKKAIDTRNHYYPLEMSNTLSREEKYQLMTEWWTTAHDLLVECNLKKSDIEDMVRDARVLLREHSNVMFEMLERCGVPLLIFSAGIGDILLEAIKQENLHSYKNVQVISNFMEFDDEDKLVGFKGELIHTYNKHEAAVHHPEYFERHRKRDNIILLGDTLGDLSMVDGMPYTKHTLTIGFLNDHIEQNLEMYKDHFDIVLVSDETMDLPIAVLKKIL